MQHAVYVLQETGWRDVGKVEVYNMQYAVYYRRLGGGM
jgi:hypothetical protein